jgi:hypothetical protein
MNIIKIKVRFHAKCSLHDCFNKDMLVKYNQIPGHINKTDREWDKISRLTQIVLFLD